MQLDAAFQHTKEVKSRPGVCGVMLYTVTAASTAYHLINLQVTYLATTTLLRQTGGYLLCSSNVASAVIKQESVPAVGWNALTCMTCK